MDVARAETRELLIERYEYKYLVPERLLRAIRQTALTTCRLDRHSGPAGTYRIRSLYFDTRDYALFQANSREAANRFKVRARVYPGTNSPVFLEVKNRVLDSIVKTRAAVRAEDWQSVMNGNEAALGELSKSNLRGAVAFAGRIEAHHLQPKLLVEYEREAYVSDVDSYGRLTFDRNIQVQPQYEADLDANAARWRAIDHTFRTRSGSAVCVLELKFERRAPAWMAALVQRLELTRASFSKYCYGIGDEHAAPALRTAAFAG